MTRKEIFGLLVAAGFVMSMGMTTPVSAQQSEEDTTQTEADQGTIDSELSLGEEENPDQIGKAYIKVEHGDWDLRCLRTENPDEDPCQMYQLLFDEAGGAVAEVSLFRLPAGGQAVAGSTIVVPLETALQQQLRVQVDGNTVKRYPFSFCTTTGCFARIGLTQEDVNLWKAGNVAKISIVSIASPEKPIVVDLSLAGFTKAYSEVTVAAQ